MKMSREHQDAVIWKENKEWYYIDEERDIYVLTNKAPEHARRSFEKWKKINGLGDLNREKKLSAHNMQTADNVACWFLLQNEVKVLNGEADYISNLKLQKLLYYAQGVYLALYDEPLFGDEIVAWQYGPVVKGVYQTYCYSGADGIKDFDNPIENFSEREKGVLQFTYKAFGQFSAWKLIDMTHEESPWKDTEINSVIALDKIKKFFTENYLEATSEGAVF